MATLKKKVRHTFEKKKPLRHDMSEPRARRSHAGSQIFNPTRPTWRFIHRDTGRRPPKRQDRTGQAESAPSVRRRQFCKRTAGPCARRAAILAQATPVRRSLTPVSLLHSHAKRHGAEEDPGRLRPKGRRPAHPTPERLHGNQPIPDVVP